MIFPNKANENLIYVTLLTHCLSIKHSSCAQYSIDFYHSNHDAGPV